MITEAVPTTATINPAQLRAARALLGWQQIDLAERASVSVETIKRLEKRHEASVSTRLSTARAIESAFVAAGVVFWRGGAALAAAA